MQFSHEAMILQKSGIGATADASRQLWFFYTSASLNSLSKQIRSSVRTKIWKRGTIQLAPDARLDGFATGVLKASGGASAEQIRVSCLVLLASGV